MYNVGVISSVLKEVCQIEYTKCCFVDGVGKSLIFKSSTVWLIICNLVLFYQIGIFFSYFSFLFRFFILSLQSISIRSHYVEETMFPLRQNDDIEPTQCGIRNVFCLEALMNDAGSVEEITT